MATLTHPAPVAPRRHRPARVGRRPVRPAAPPAAAPAETPPVPARSEYTRSALPLALTWFAIPALLLVLSLAFGWHF